MPARDPIMADIEESMVPDDTMLSPEEIQLVQRYRAASSASKNAWRSLTPEQLHAHAAERAFGTGMSEREKLAEQQKLMELRARLLRDYGSVEVAQEQTARQRVKAAADAAAAAWRYLEGEVATQGGIKREVVQFYKSAYTAGSDKVKRSAPPEYNDLNPRQKEAIDKLLPYDDNGNPLDELGATAVIAQTAQALSDDPRSITVLDDRVQQLWGVSLSDLVGPNASMDMNVTDKKVLENAVKERDLAEHEAYRLGAEGRREMADAEREVGKQGAGNKGARARAMEVISGATEAMNNPDVPIPSVDMLPAEARTEMESAGAVLPPGGTQPRAPTAAPPRAAAPPAGSMDVSTSTSTAPSQVSGMRVKYSGPTSGAQSRIDEMLAMVDAQIAKLGSMSNEPEVVTLRRNLMQSQPFKDFAARFNLQNDLDTAFQLYLRQAKRELNEQREMGAGAYHGAAKEGKVQLIPGAEHTEDIQADAEFDRALRERAGGVATKARAEKKSREQTKIDRLNRERQAEVMWAEGRMADEDNERKRAAAATEVTGKPTKPVPAPTPSMTVEWDKMKLEPAPGPTTMYEQETEENKARTTPSASAAAVPSDALFREELLKEYEE